MRFKLLKTMLFGLFLSVSSLANAGLIFSDVSYTDSSLTFTVNGDMSGYDLSNVHGKSVFAVRYYGDIWGGKHHSSNTWAGSAFDGLTQIFQGYTGSWDYNYSWSALSSNINNASTATNNVVTVSFGSGYLLTDATDYSISFIVGNGNDDSSVVLGRYTQATDVTEPSTLAVFALGMIGLASRRFKK